MAVSYPISGHKISTQRYRVDATPFLSETDALAAIMEYKETFGEANACSIRQYRNEGFFVFIQFPLGGSCWLTYKGNNL
jgi:hypothetical protein